MITATQPRDLGEGLLGDGRDGAEGGRCVIGVDEHVDGAVEGQGRRHAGPGADVGRVVREEDHGRVVVNVEEGELAKIDPFTIIIRMIMILIIPIIVQPSSLCLLSNHPNDARTTIAILLVVNAILIPDSILQGTIISITLGVWSKGISYLAALASEHHEGGVEPLEELGEPVEAEATRQQCIRLPAQAASLSLDERR